MSAKVIFQQSYTFESGGHCYADTHCAKSPRRKPRTNILEQLILQIQIMLCRAMLETGTSRRTLARRLGMTPRQFTAFCNDPNMDFRKLSDAMVAMGRRLEVSLDKF